MTSHTSCILFALSAMMMLISTVNSSDPSSQSELYSASNAYSKNDEDFTIDKRPSFFVGSRYGRSPQLYGTKARRLNIVPRNDRFFLGSRYGKRSNEYTIPTLYDQDTTSSSSAASKSIITNQSNDYNNDNNHNNYHKMSCIYTGYKNYFKCNSVNGMNNLIQQLSNDENLI